MFALYVGAAREDRPIGPCSHYHEQDAVSYRGGRPSTTVLCRPLAHTHVDMTLRIQGMQIRFICSNLGSFMDGPQAVEAIADEMQPLLGRFQKSDSFGLFLQAEDQARFKRLAIEAKAQIDESLQIPNDFSVNLVLAITRGSVGMVGGPSYSAVLESIELIRGAANAMRRKQASKSRSSLNINPKPSYVDPARIVALYQLKGKTFDYSRLAQMCGELNMASESGAHLSVAMLVRAITDHIPPIFGQANFASVVANFPGKSNKQIVQTLENNLRPIADKWLHTHIRAKESVPTEVQVDFRQALDALLEEVIRIA